MRLVLTPQQSAQQAAVRRFLEDAAGTFVPTCDGWITGWDRAFSRNLAERGWIGITWPTRHGGRGGTYVDRLVVYEPLLAAGAPLAAHWFADRQVAPAILAHGSEAQRHRYLPEIRAGEVTYCIGISEPDAGSDVAAIRTRAERTPDGWWIEGTKVWTSLAGQADYIYLLARTWTVEGDRHAGLSEFIVPMDSPGITVRPIPELSGRHHFNEVFFDGVVVEDDALIGVEGQGWRQIMGQLGYERSGLERLMSVWPLLSALRETAAGDPRREEELGELESVLDAARLLAFRAAAVADLGRPPDHEAAMAKWFGTEIEQRVVEVASQWAGQAARVRGSDALAAFGGQLALAWRLAPSFTIRGGASEILAGVVARWALAG